MATVAIIGGGPAGLTAAKSALDCGLVPTLFEKSSSIGGVWQPKCGTVWDSMRTNDSHYTIMFSDFPWKRPVEDYPHNSKLHEYLCEYAKHFKVDQHLKLNCAVESISHHSNNKWNVQWTQGEEQLESKVFDFVIIATGIYTKPHVPHFQGVENFKGQIFNSKQYRNPEAFRGKNVVVVGNAFSGCEIASEIASTAKLVTHVFRRSQWILPRYVPTGKGKDDKIPWDLIFYSRASPLNAPVASIEEADFRINSWFQSVCGGQEHIAPELAVNIDFKDTPYFNITDGYLKNVEQKRISLKKSTIRFIEEDSITFEDGTSSGNIDAIIFCTGYRTELPFFDEEILNELEYQMDCKIQPVLLHKTVFPRNLPGMAFVGVASPPFFAVIELQAKWACMAFSGKVPMPSKEEMERGIAEERAIRKMKPAPQFAHHDLVSIADDLADEIGVKPDFEQIRNEDPDLFRKLWYGPFLSSCYILQGFGSKYELASEIIDQGMEYLKSKNTGTGTIRHVA